MHYYQRMHDPFDAVTRPLSLLRDGSARKICVFSDFRDQECCVRSRGQRFPVRRTVCWMRRDRRRCLLSSLPATHLRGRRALHAATTAAATAKTIVTRDLHRCSLYGGAGVEIFSQYKNDQMRFWVSEWWWDYRTDLMVMRASVAPTTDADL